MLDTTTHSTAASSYVGYVEVLTPDKIEGWAINRKDLTNRPRVKAILDGNVIGSATCDIYREHVARSGAGDGRYGFSIPIPQALGSKLDQILVEVHAEDGAPPFRLHMSAQVAGRSRATASMTQPVVDELAGPLLNVSFDASDLVQYFRNSAANLEMRLPTGIQRVQIEIITSLVFGVPEGYTVKIVAFSEKSDFWVELDQGFFNRLCKLSLVGGSAHTSDWQQVLLELESRITNSPKVAFPQGSYLINLGTSWWLQNYFLNIRAAKEKYGIKYVPFIHDCIPIMIPEHCTVEVTRNFISWLQGVFQHADHFMANSKASANDLLKAAKYLGYDVPPPSVVPLDADYRQATSALTTTYDDGDRESLFLKHGIRSANYVLFVSTVESRKNHLLAFSAWLKLIKKHGLAHVPHLVCVGKRGWLNDAIYATLGSSELLKQRVVMLSNIPDPDLERLYQNCRFTLYPSSYEGWGLPVTESLSYGKVPLIGKESSLPEAGGRFAEYVDLGSETDLVEKLTRLLFDREYLEDREKEIAHGFRARSWKEIADHTLRHVHDWAASREGKPTPTQPQSWLFMATPGRYYGFIDNHETQLRPGMMSGELFRQGNGWWGPEPWGCWTKDRPGRFSFLFDAPAGKAVTLFIGIRGVQGHHSTGTVMIENLCARTIGLGPEQDQWLIFRLDAKSIERLSRIDGAVLIEVLCSSDRTADFGRSTNGADPRIAGLGVRGFMVCLEDDTVARLNLLESVALNDMFSMSGGLLSERLDPPAVWGETSTFPDALESKAEGTP